MSELTSPKAETFSLTDGGPFHQLLVRLGQKRTERSRVIRRAVRGSILAWLPCSACPSRRVSRSGRGSRCPSFSTSP